LRILLGVHQFFPAFYTGTERYVLNLASQLQRMGHFVKVFTYAFGDHDGFRQGYSSKMLYKEYTYEGVPVVAIRHKDQPSDLNFIFDFMDADVYEEARQIFKKGNFDIYHCAHPVRIASSIKAAKDEGIKTVLMVTDYWLMCPMGIMLRPDNTLCDGPDHGRNCRRYCFPQVAGARMQKRNSDVSDLVECSDAVLSPSQFLIRLFDHTKVIPSDRFILSRHGFDYAKKKMYFLRTPDDIITFGYIGTIQYHKGVHVMVEGFKRAPQRNIRLVIWGGCFHEIGYQKSVVKIADGDPRIEFRGPYNFNDIETILEPIHVVIVPSIWYENAPLTINTSLAYGIPVIASDIGGMCEAVKAEDNGLTFAVGNPDDLTDRICSVANNPELIGLFKRNIRYPIRVEEEAFNTELIYKQCLIT
jgi:glycosyltransferase involved in cell wall biosynthesis